jgi:tRNA(adenine34) deaminase
VASDQEWMQVALAEADQAVAHGDVPVGCVIVGSDGKLMARAHNQRELSNDPTAHAEILALRAASARQRHWRLEGATVFVTLEPCAMCAGALVNARILRLVYATSDPKAGAVDSMFSIGRDARLNHCFEVEAGLLGEESVSRLQLFFRALRAAGEK